MRAMKEVLNDIYTDGCKEKEVPLVRFLQSVVGRIRTAPGGVHHPEQYKAVNAIRVCRTTAFGDRHIRLSRLWGSTGNQP